MFGLPIGLLIRIGAALAVAAALAWGWHLFTEHYREQGRAEVRVEWEADKARRVALTTAQTLLWDDQRKKTEEAIRDRDREREQRANDNRLRARQLARDIAAAPVAGAAVRVLNDAIDDTAAATGTAGGIVRKDAAAAENPDSTIGDLVEWGVTVVDLYETCRARLTGWQQFYADLRAAQPQEAPP